MNLDESQSYSAAKMIVDEEIVQLLNDVVERVASASSPTRNFENLTSTPVSNIDEEMNQLVMTMRKSRHSRVLSDPSQVSFLTPPPDEDERQRSLNSSLEVEEENQWLSDSWRQAKQSLIDARLHDLEVSRELERENTHLYLSEMLIAAVEQMKWRSVIAGAVLCEGGPRASSTSGIGQSLEEPVMNAMGDESYPASEYSLPSSSCDADTPNTSTPSSSRFYAHRSGSAERELVSPERPPAPDDEDTKSPEAIAAALLRHFSRKHRQAAGDIDWLVSYADAPQLLLPMPNDEFVSPDEVYSSSGEHSKKVRLRGTFEWAPPRKQWIFHLHSAQIKLRPMLEKQKYRCAGCGMKLDNKIYARRVRYCDYYGRFFCQCCHRGDKARVPARILHQWSFKEYPVSDLAFRFLREANGQPVFNLMAIDSKLYDRVKALRIIRDLRVKLVHMWNYVRTCRWTDEVVTKDGNLKAMFTSLPPHLLREADVYSLADLNTVYDGQLLNHLEPIVQYGRYHIEGCQHCRAQAFVCEWCNSDELLFPFQVEKVRRCVACGSLAHVKCVAKNRNGICPKCVRLEQRRIRLTRASSSRSSVTSANDESDSVI